MLSRNQLPHYFAPTCRDSVTNLVLFLGGGSICSASSTVKPQRSLAGNAGQKLCGSGRCLLLLFGRIQQRVHDHITSFPPFGGSDVA